MAKFTKLSIGDIVASSGGRVWKKLSVESAEVDELVGTWVFNQDADPTMLEQIGGINVVGSFSYNYGSGIAVSPLKSIMKTSYALYLESNDYNVYTYPYYQNKYLYEKSYNGITNETFYRPSADDSHSMKSTYREANIPLFTFTIDSVREDIDNFHEAFIAWLQANATKTA